ncbi:MAG: transposase [Blautia sp.]|nr:transposase [Blautia sp.]
MPGVKKYKQESETQSKPAMMFGHLWGCVGVLTEVNGGITSTPVSMKLHGGLKGMETWSAWKDYGFSVASHVVQILNDACETADRFAEDCVVLLDRYHLTVPAMKALIAHNSSDKRKSFVYVIIKAKRSAVGYHLPMPKEKSKRGPQKKRGDKVRLWELFDSDIDKFKEVKLELYGKERTVSCYTIDLLWGKGINTMLRFVLSKLDSGEKSLFVTNDLTLSAEDVIYLYSLRAKIETGFRAMKQNVGCFSYHFWSKSMPKLNLYKKKEDPDPINSVTDPEDQIKILDTIKATEMFMLASTVSMSILHALTISANEPAIRAMLRYQRTPAKSRPSEDNMMVLMRQLIWTLVDENPNSPISAIIRNKQKDLFGRCRQKIG